jgi:hypothetical protein
MTKERATVPWRVADELKAFFIAMGGPQAMTPSFGMTILLHR